MCDLTFKTKRQLGSHKPWHTRKFQDLKQDRTRREFLVRKRGRFCQVCNKSRWQGKPIPLELHHQDGNPANNVEDNCIVICPNCHAQTSSCRGKNIGNSSQQRRKSNAKYGPYR